MKTSAGNLFGFFAAVLAVASVTGFAQNVASQPGTVSRNTDHLTLLPGPTLLSPARGAGVPPPIVGAGPATFRFLPVRNRSVSPLPPAASRRAGVLTLGSDPTAIPALPAARKTLAPPNPESLWFKSKLEAVPASLRSPTPTTLRRD